MAFIDAHRDRFGVEPMCRVLREHGCGIGPNAYWWPSTAHALQIGPLASST